MPDVFEPARRWTVSKTNSEYLRYIAAKFSISPVLAQVLVGRGVRSPEDVRRFLEPDLGDLHDAFAIPDMAVACDRIRHAAAHGEQVLVVGDYDVDGLTSTAVLTDVLERLGVSQRHIIPHRLSDGYGLKAAFLEEAARSGVHLVITVDCGISAVTEARLASSLGLDLIITDHHRQSGPMPEALAVVNPHRNDSTYPFPELAGVGVVYKLAESLLGRQGARAYLDLVALGTVADIVPLLDENRILVRAGLDAIRTFPRPGIQALCSRASLDTATLTSNRLSYVLAPRLNAAGRLGDANPVIDLFKTQDTEKAAELADQLDQANRERQKLDSAVFAEARALADVPEPSDVAVLGSESWHPGVLGIAAARLVDLTGRPVFLLNLENGLAKGSGRSIPAFNLVAALEACADLLEGFGGHHQAAGIRLKTGHIQEFRDRISNVFRSQVEPDDLVPLLTLDAEVRATDLTLDLVKEIERLEPVGFGNQSPVLGCKGLSVTSSRLVGRNHLKLRLSGGRASLDAILFGAGEDALERIPDQGHIDVAFVPQINEWEGRRSLQINLRGIRRG